MDPNAVTRLREMWRACDFECQLDRILACSVDYLLHCNVVAMVRML